MCLCNHWPPSTPRAGTEGRTVTKISPPVTHVVSRQIRLLPSCDFFFSFIFISLLHTHHQNKRFHGKRPCQNCLRFSHLEARTWSCLSKCPHEDEYPWITGCYRKKCTDQICYETLALWFKYAALWVLNGLKCHFRSSNLPPFVCILNARKQNCQQ